MGVARSCSSSHWRYSPVIAKFGSHSSAQSVKLLEWDGQLDTSRAVANEALRTDPAKQEITFNEFDASKPNTYYWSLPDRYIILCTHLGTKLISVKKKASQWIYQCVQILSLIDEVPSPIHNFSLYDYFLYKRISLARNNHTFSTAGF